MKSRFFALIAVFALVVVACDGDDAELSSDSTIITGGTNAPATTTTTADPDGSGGDSTATTAPRVGETVTDFTIVARFPNDNGEERYYVIPDGAYTDVDLENFIIELIETDPTLYGAEVFRSEEAAEAYQVDVDSRTEEQAELLEEQHFVTLVGRDRIEFRGPFSEFPGGAIGS